MQKADDINTTLEVGKFYLVKCAVMKNTNTDFVFYVPIIGINHKDAQFGVHQEHVHIDGRFSSVGYNHFEVDANGKTNGIVDLDKKQVCIFDGYEYKRKKCRRLTTGIKPPPYNRRYMEWYKTYIGQDCKGKKCPHLGTDMFNDGNGKLVCPLHNLIGDCKTEKIIPYESKH